MVKCCWRFLGSINLTIWLLLAITLNLITGSIFAKFFAAEFNKLNFMTFQEWLTTTGTLSHTWWVWSLFALLSLFSLNTAVCTFDRMLFLLKKRGEYAFRQYVVLLSPSVMHLCFLAIIGGHAVSQFTADIHQLPVSAGATLSLSPFRVTVIGSDTLYRKEPGLTGLPRQCTASLSLTSPEGTVTGKVGILEPFLWESYSIHLHFAGKPAQGETPKLQLTVKKDPGLPLILLGNAFLCLLMLWYFPIIIRNRT